MDALVPDSRQFCKDVRVQQQEQGLQHKAADSSILENTHLSSVYPRCTCTSPLLLKCFEHGATGLACTVVVNQLLSCELSCVTLVPWPHNVLPLVMLLSTLTQLYSLFPWSQLQYGYVLHCLLPVPAMNNVALKCATQCNFFKFYGRTVTGQHWSGKCSSKKTCILVQANHLASLPIHLLAGGQCLPELVGCTSQQEILRAECTDTVWSVVCRLSMFCWKAFLSSPC